jgi:hypothetical protein
MKSIAFFNCFSYSTWIRIRIWLDKCLDPNLRPDSMNFDLKDCFSFSYTCWYPTYIYFAVTSVSFRYFCSEEFCKDGFAFSSACPDLEQEGCALLLTDYPGKDHIFQLRLSKVCTLCFQNENINFFQPSW